MSSVHPPAPPVATPDDDDAEVFRRPSARSWLVSALAHAGVFVAIGIVGTYIGVRTGVLPHFTVAEFDVSPPPRRPPPPPPRTPPPPSPNAPPAHREAARVRAPQPQRGAHRSRTADAPHVLAASGTSGGSGGDSMAVGENNDFRGGLAGNGGEAAPVEPVPAPVAQAPDAHAGRNEVDETPERDLAQRAVLQCDDVALAALYPQDALDGDVQVPVLPIEFAVAADGAITRIAARANPGFGIAAAMEHGARLHCHVTSPARNRRGEAVRTRVVWRLRFQFE